MQASICNGDIETVMELLQYFRILRRWFWLIALAAFVGGSLSFISRVTQAPLYRTQVTIAIGNYLESPNPNSAEIRTGIDLAQTYAQLVRTYDVLNGVVQSLQLPFGVDKLNDLIDTDIVAGTSLLQISVSYTDPVLTADVTNEIATQLILRSPSNLTLEQQTQVNILQDEIDAQRLELQELREQLDEVDLSLDDTDLSTDEHQSLQQQRNILVDQINEASANIAQFTNTIASFQQRTNSVEIVESARIPIEPIGTSLINTVILGILVGAALAFGGVLAYEYINDRLRTADEVIQALNLPVLGVISRFGKKGDKYDERLIITLPSFSQTSEEYRTLRTNLLYTAEKKKRAFIVSSASPQEGKSVTASNLAASMALSGLRVLLIDADLRRPRVHEIFKLNNNPGLANLLTRRVEDEKGQTANAKDDPIASILDENTWQKVIQRTSIPNLYIITSGFTPSNPAELLGSLLMKRWMEEFRSSPHLDVVIFDTPPVLAVSDSAVLAASLEAKVLLVTHAGQTRRSVALKAKERFTNIKVDVVGVVLNAADLRDEDYYGYNYSYYYTDSQNPPAEQANKP
jgi:polysaccharide biosynthesis transport protein